MFRFQVQVPTTVIELTLSANSSLICYKLSEDGVSRLRLVATRAVAVRQKSLWWCAGCRHTFSGVIKGVGVRGKGKKISLNRIKFLCHPLKFLTTFLKSSTAKFHIIQRRLCYAFWRPCYLKTFVLRTLDQFTQPNNYHVGLQILTSNLILRPLFVLRPGSAATPCPLITPLHTLPWAVKNRE